MESTGSDGWGGRVMSENIVDLINVSREVSWLTWGVQYFFLIGISYGAFFLTLPAFVFARKEMRQMGRIALVVAITCGIAAPIALVSDLHQPGRFYQFYLHFTATSWMSWGSFFLPAYIVFLLLYAWFIYRPDLQQQADNSRGVFASVSRLLAFGGGSAPGAIKALGYLTLLSAVLVATYTGAEMAVVRARPLWNSPVMPLMFFLTGICGAAGLALLLNKIIGNASRTVAEQLNYILMFILGLIISTLLLWLLLGLVAQSSSGEVLVGLATEYNAFLFSLLFLLGCTLFPFLMVTKTILRIDWLTGLLTLSGAWLFRWSMFIDGQRIPKNSGGFNEYSIPLGSDGLLGIAGTVGLWILLVLAVTSFIPWQGSKKNSSK